MLSLLKSHSTTEGLLHLTTSIALFMGFCLTLLGLWIFMFSQNWDKTGLSRPLPFLLGSITTYLALSQTVTAFMYEYLFDLKLMLDAVNINTKLHHIGKGEWDFVFILLSIMGGLLWILITYIAPIHSMGKHGIVKGKTLPIVGYYLVIQIPIYWIYAKAWNVQYNTGDQPLNMWEIFALQFLQPILWWLH
jgi:uncharacterized membrane protein